MNSNAYKIEACQPEQAKTSNVIAMTPTKYNKDGTPKKTICHKKKGRKSEVYPFQVEDLKKMMDYFRSHNMWHQYLIFVLGVNLARRIGDTLALKWENFYNPETGDFRTDLLDIVEDKTEKLSSPHINNAVREAINLFIEKTHCNPAKDNYTEYVFMQYTGSHQGSVMSDEGYRKALKKAAKEVGITYNVGTHSTRKTFGMMSRMLHPSDYDSMELLQTIYNHEDTKTTSRYIGLTKKKVDKYYDDMGEFFNDYVTGNKEYKAVAETPIVSLDTNDLRDIIKAAYKAGGDNANATDPVIHIESINNIMSLIEGLAK